MAHHRYQTEAIVLGSVPRGESNRSFFLFTKEFGLIAASAQGVRKISSKLKGNLSDFSHVHIDLIRGGDMWRVVDADGREHPSSFADANTLRSFALFSLLVRRLVHGERTDATLFSAIVAFRKFLTEGTHAPEVCKSLEIIMAVKILHELGYGGNETHALRVYTEPLSPDLISFVGKYRHTLTVFVNTRLRESHL